MRKLLVAALMVVMASPAFAAIQNVKVSGDITTTFIDRDDFDLGSTAGNTLGTVGSGSWDPLGLKKQNVFITQTRLRVDADLSDNVSTEVGLINERAWNTENSPASASSNPSATSNVDNLDTNVQLYLATLTLREFLYSPLSVTIGRQIFNYGNGLIIGTGGPNNSSTGNLQYIAGDFTERTSYDGVRAVLDYKPLTIDMIYFKNNQYTLNGNAEENKTSSDVFGYNANYQLSDPWNTVVEQYMFSRLNGNSDQAGGAVMSDKGNTLFVPGLRASTNPIKGLNVQGELAWQLGQNVVTTTVDGHNTQEAEKRNAMAAQFLASYALPVMTKYKPTVNASYTYVSGDKDATDNYGNVPFKNSKYYSAWDEFNKNQGAGTIYNTMFPMTNMNIYAIGGSVNPLEDVTVAATWSDLESAEYNSSANNPLTLLQPDGSTITMPTSNKRGLGNESDLNVTYNYTEDVTFGVSLGWFVPGDAFTKATRNTASQAIADVAVTF